MWITSDHLTADQIWFLFGELDRELASANAESGVAVIVGGGAMAVWWADRGSVDVDCINRLSPEVKTAVADVARNHSGLSTDWLNDHAAAFRLRMDAEETLWFEGQRLHVYVASPFYVLVMKLFAARTDPAASDVEDVARLMGHLGFSTAEHLLEIAADIHQKDISAVRYMPDRIAGFCDMAEARYREHGGT